MLTGVSRWQKLRSRISLYELYPLAHDVISTNACSTSTISFTNFDNSPHIAIAPYFCDNLKSQLSCFIANDKDRLRLIRRLRFKYSVQNISFTTVDGLGHVFEDCHLWICDRCDIYCSEMHPLLWKPWCLCSSCSRIQMDALGHKLT